MGDGIQCEEMSCNGTKERFKKDSFYWYQKMIASNGEDLE